MIGDVLVLLKTFVEIILLRKGPDALPRARIVLVIAVALWLLSSVVALLSVESYTSRAFMVGLLTGGVGLIIYTLLINAAGKIDRLERALSAIIGCGSVLSFVVLIVQGVLANVFVDAQINAIIAFIWLWSVPVEGHIIARTLDRLWFVGFVAAMMVFVVQLFLLASLDSSHDQKSQEQDPQYSSEPA